MKDVATRQVDDYIQSQKKRKQIFSITLDQELYDDAMIIANKKHDGNFSKCVTTALEEYIDKEVAKGLALVNDK
jgi:metal-responsive CopG/Arc/MetJ family transcriptional regulator